jgi:hypothetical protein
VENAAVEDIGLRSISVMLAMVGLDISMRAYPSGQPLRDEAHRCLLARFRALLPPGSAWRTEVPLPVPGDLRAWDAMTHLWGHSVGIEAELRPTDLQALERRLELKKRDAGVDRLILVLADTRSNRAFLRWAGASLKERFRLQGRQALDALHGPRDPGSDLLVMVTSAGRTVPPRPVSPRRLAEPRESDPDVPARHAADGHRLCR